jgi:hypothetical protein
VRNRYVTDSAWNVDGTLLQLRSYDPVRPYQVVLDGETYEPLLISTAPSTIFRWSQDPAKPTIQYLLVSDTPDLIVDEETGTTAPPGPQDDLIIEFDVMTGTVVRQFQLPFWKFASGKTTVAYVDGREYVALLGRDKAAPSAGVYLYIVDLNFVQGAEAPVVAQFLLTNANCGLGSAAACAAVDPNGLHFSPDGSHVLVSYSAAAGSSGGRRLLDVDLAAGTIAPHALPSLPDESLPYFVPGDRAQGFFPVAWSHPVFAMGANGQDVYLVGGAGNFAGRSVPGVDTSGTNGKVGVLSFHLATNTYRSLTDPTDEAAVSHVSATNLANPGYIFVSYASALSGGTVHRGEVVAIRLDNPQGEGGVIPIIQHRTNAANDQYHAEPHINISPDGSKLLFPSTWGPLQSEVGAYVVDLNLPDPDAAL